MKTIWFIPALVGLLLVLVGFVAAVAAALILRKTAKGQSRQRSVGEVPPLLAGAERNDPAQSGGIGLGKFFLAAGVLVLLAGLLGTWQTGLVIGWAGNSVPEWSDGRAPGLEGLIRKNCVPFITKGGSLGLTVAVVAASNTTVMAFGRSSLCGGAPACGDTLYEIGSITKTFTALALAREIEAGTVRLDEPVQELLPAGVELPAAARAVTLRHLTTHTSGFPRMPANLSPLSGLQMMLFGRDPYADYSAAAFQEAVRTVKLASPPGKKLDYSNFGIGLLGYALARKTGRNYQTFIKAEVCQPLGMDDTTMTLTGAQARRFAQGYRALWRFGPVAVGLRSAPWNLPNHLAGAGALRSTGADMLKYLEANMHPPGGLLGQAVVNSHRELFRESQATAIGMNWLRTHDGVLQQTLIWHNGGTGGFCSFLGFTADGRAGVVVLANTAESVDALGRRLLHELAGSAAGGCRGSTLSTARGE